MQDLLITVWIALTIPTVLHVRLTILFLRKGDALYVLIISQIALYALQVQHVQVACKII